MLLENETKVEDEVKVTKKAKGPKEPIVEPSLEENIVLWKKQFGKVYKNELEDEAIIWRAIKRGEYRQLLKVSEELEPEERLLAKQETTVIMATLYPKNIAELIERNAGLATVLSEEILAKSGFDITETQAL